MKNYIKTLTALMCGIILLSGCGGKKEEKAAEPEVKVEAPEVKEPEVDEEALEIEKFFADYVNTTKRPVAVMVDNDDKNARPQAGLDEAYLVYEMVVEGGATRFMALFNNDTTEKIGPVRSSRHYFLDFLMENDAIYTHFGWSPKASADIPAFGINNINGILGSDGGTFWREKKYKGDWHSAYTSMEKIKSMASQKGYKAETEHKNGIKYSDKYISLSGDNAANSVYLKYSDRYNTGYKYNAETKLYEKQINGAPHTMQNGKTLAFKNIIIELISDTALGDGTSRRNINTAGSGNGYYITNGSYEKITWSKASRRDNTVYKKEDGTELLINPGSTVINLISPSNGVSFE